MGGKEASFVERAWGVLAGCAVGDAMGMPTEMMSREDIAELFPDGVRELSASTARDAFGRKLRAGEITDDTVNTVLVARCLIESGGAINARAYIDHLESWVDEHRETSRSVVGPNTMRALSAIKEGAPLERAGIFGTTNGGAMKISPVGIVRDYHDLADLVDAVEQVCLPTHNTGAAIACASAVAAAVSCAVRGRGDAGELWDVALAAAEMGERRGYAFPCASVTARMRAVRDLVEHEPAQEALRQLQEFYGMGVESVETAPAVLAVVTLAGGDPWEAACLAAGSGGDTDTIGAIATAICGGLNPCQVPREVVATIEDVNELDLGALAHSLAHLAG